MTKVAELVEDPVVITGNSKAFAFMFFFMFLFMFGGFYTMAFYQLPQDDHICLVGCTGVFGFGAVLAAGLIVYLLLPKTVVVSSRSIEFRVLGFTRFFAGTDEITAIRSYAQTKHGYRQEYFKFEQVRSPVFCFFNNCSLIIETRDGKFLLNSGRDMNRKKIFKVGQAIGCLWDLWELPGVELEDHLDIIRAE